MTRGESPRDEEQPAVSEEVRSTSSRLIMQAFGQQITFRLLGMVANIVTVTLTTRHLGPDLYGTLTTAIVFVALWTSFTELGVGSVIVRKVMSKTGSLERLIRVNAGMSLVYAIPLTAVASISGWALYQRSDEVVAMVLIISLSLTLTTISSCFQPIFMSTMRFFSVGASDFLGRVASLGATVALVQWQSPLIWFAAVQLAPPVVVLAVQGMAASRLINCRPVFSVRESWDLLRESLPQTCVLIIGVLYWRVDGVILSLRSTLDEVGIYGLAYTLAFTVSVLPGFFGTSTLSAMTHLFASNRSRFASFAAGSVESMLFLAMPIAAVGCILGPKIIASIGSPAFVERGGPTLGLLLLAASIGFVTGVLSQALFAAHDQAFLLKLNIFNLILNITLNIILAPLLGAIGAGIAMLATECVGLLVASWRLSRITDYHTPWPMLFRLLVPLAACSSVGALAHDLSIFISLPVAASTYLLVNLAAGPITLGKLKLLLKKPEEVVG